MSTVRHLRRPAWLEQSEMGRRAADEEREVTGGSCHVGPQRSW